MPLVEARQRQYIWVSHFSARMKKPATRNVSAGRTKGNDDAKALAEALGGWASRANFISYTSDRMLG